MAARLNRRHQDLVREKIKLSMVLDRLEQCVAGTVELTPAQVQSAKILLDKSLSNAQTDVHMTGEMQINWPLPKTPLDG